MPRVGQRLGKYKLQARLAEGAFAVVYRALDTLEGVQVALKIPHPELLTSDALEDLRREVRLTARLEHPNILQLKTADYIDSRLIFEFALGEESLEDRLQRRMSVRSCLDLGQQMLAALAFAHQHHVVHCDLKPENLMLFSGGRLRLCDFGISKIVFRTLAATGGGTVGYMSPEQALGRASLRSDVFAGGLVLWRMFSGKLPDWPFEWSFPGHERVKRKFHPEMIAVVRRALDVKPNRRFADAGQMLAAYLRAKPKAMQSVSSPPSKSKQKTDRHWKEVRQRQFTKQFGRKLQTGRKCARCQGPVAEFMQACPWCGVRRRVVKEETSFPICRPRCRRGMKLDWMYCPWCHGPGFEPHTNRAYSDVR